jgi:hypothetical protein
MSEERSISELISDITEFNDISIYLKDEDVDSAMAKIINLVARPDVPPKLVAPLIVKLQALSVKFNLQAKYYMLYSVEKEEKIKKKNTYLSLSDGLEKLANALKYLVKD